MVCHCHNSFLLFCQLSVLSERIVPSFQDHVTYHFYRLEGLMDAYNIHPLVTIYALLLYVFWTLCMISLGNKRTSSVKVVLFSHNSSPHTSLETQGRSVGPGDKARQKFSSTGGKALGYRLSLDHFQMVKRMLAPDWAQKMLCIILPNRQTPSPEFFSWARTRRLLTCTKEMHAVRNLSVWYKCYISKYW